MTKLRVHRESVVQPLDQSYRLIPLTRGKWAIVDAEDYERLSRWNWHLSGSIARNNFYAARGTRVGGKHRLIRLHHAVLGLDGGIMVDHVDGDPLNCRKSNLRICNAAGNSQNHKRTSRNKSGHTGINWHPTNKQWIVRVGSGRARKYIGGFKTLEAAVVARNAAFAEHYGEFARFD